MRLCGIFEFGLFENGYFYLYLSDRYRYLDRHIAVFNGHFSRSRGKFSVSSSVFNNYLAFVYRYCLLMYSVKRSHEFDPCRIESFKRVIFCLIGSFRHLERGKNFVSYGQRKASRSARIVQLIFGNVSPGNNVFALCKRKFGIVPAYRTRSASLFEVNADRGQLIAFL